MIDPEEEDEPPKPLDPLLLIGEDEDKNLVCVIPALPEHPGMVGTILADAIRQFGVAYAGGDKVAQAQVVMVIWRFLSAEMSNPTDELTTITPGVLDMPLDWDHD